VIALTRRYRFPAAHVLSCASLSEEENRRIYGKCASPNGHGHDYELAVTLAGAVDPRSGCLVPLDRLDALVQREVLDQLSHALLNDLPSFRVEVPTAENIAGVIFRALEGPVAEIGDAVLRRVHLVETRRNSVDFGRNGGDEI